MRRIGSLRVACLGFIGLPLLLSGGCIAAPGEVGEVEQLVGSTDPSVQACLELNNFLTDSCVNAREMEYAACMESHNQSDPNAECSGKYKTDMDKCVDDSEARYRECYENAGSGSGSGGSGSGGGGGTGGSGGSSGFVCMHNYQCAFGERCVNGFCQEESGGTGFGGLQN
jgi:uncharacterized membrane protein YgcG